MELIPIVFAVLSGAMLLTALSFLWASFRAAFSAESALDLPTAEASSRRVLEEKKHALLANLKDLDFDHAGGKIDDTDYQKLRTKLRRQAKQILRLLDEDVMPYREKAERLLRSHLGTIGLPYRDAPDTPHREEIPDDGATRESTPSDTVDHPREAREPQSSESIFCESCTTKNDNDAVFCKKCGVSLVSDSRQATSPNPKHAADVDSEESSP